MNISLRKSSLLLLAGVAAFLIAACGDSGPENGGASGEGFERVINVETRMLKAEPFVERLRLTGTTAANRDVIVAAEEAGVIREVLVDKGAMVRTGQPLARIDDRILRAEAERARAQAALATETWERRRRLFEEDRVGSELAYLEARYQAEQATAAFQALQERLDRTVVRAPIAGILEERSVEVGSMVSPGAEVGRIVEIDPIKITAGVPERFAPVVRPGAETTITFDILPGESFTRPIQYVASTVNPRNRTFLIELLLPNPGNRIKPEMIAGLEVVLGLRQDAVVVPQEALVRVEEGFVAYVVEGEGPGARARVRPVRTGPVQRNAVLIEEGLAPGDRLVVVGQKQLAEGDRVQVVRDRQGPNR
jgi:membrane fusion protein, multidrug efflux system